jgi:hypothetical protein
VRRLRYLAAVGLLWAVWQVPALAEDVAPAKSESSGCGEFGTSVDFEPTPSDAARKALKEEKLVFVLHISGIFEDPGLT